MNKIKKLETFIMAISMLVIIFMSGFASGVFIANNPVNVEASAPVSPQKLTIVTPSKLKTYDKIHVIERKADGNVYQDISSEGYTIKNADGSLDVTLLTDIQE